MWGICSQADFFAIAHNAFYQHLIVLSFTRYNVRQHIRTMGLRRVCTDADCFHRYRGLLRRCLSQTTQYIRIFRRGPVHVVHPSGVVSDSDVWVVGDDTGDTSRVLRIWHPVDTWGTWQPDSDADRNLLSPRVHPETEAVYALWGQWKLIIFTLRLYTYCVHAWTIMPLSTEKYVIGTCNDVES